MRVSSRTIRLFVSSTFKDLKAERDALQRDVFPRLRQLCLSKGVRFQAVDLRWGISREAARDNKTMRICLRELNRCQQDRPKPNFLVLLGDRYGWRPLPETIPAALFAKLAAFLHSTNPTAATLFENVYRIDENAVPPAAELQPRGDDDNWETRVGAPLRMALEIAVAALSYEPGLATLPIGLGATHQEILSGALKLEPEDAREHVHTFVREIRNLSGDPLPDDFVDPDADDQTRSLLAQLKRQLEHHLGKDNVHHFPLDWEKNDGANGGRFTEGSLRNFCDDVYAALSAVIETQVAKLNAVPPDQEEEQAHYDFGVERCRRFVGRKEPLQRIAAYLRAVTGKPLAVIGPAGSGKSAVMARAVKDLHEATSRDRRAETIARYIGATPKSTDAIQLLRNLVAQIRRRYPAATESAPHQLSASHSVETRGLKSTDDEVPSDYNLLIRAFYEALQRPIKERPLFLFLDGLDQLTASERGGDSSWLPDSLSPHVRLVVSVVLPADNDSRELSPTPALRESLGSTLATLTSRLNVEHHITLAPLTAADGEEILSNWLADAHRTLQPKQRQAILISFQIEGSPLWLRTATEEMTRLASWQDAPSLAPTAHGVLRQVLDRLSRNDEHGEILVSRTLGYLACARHGLAEDEMLDLLSADSVVMTDFEFRSHKSLKTDRLPVVVWVRLHGDLSYYLSEHEFQGIRLFGFYHRSIQEAVFGKFLDKDEKACVMHGNLADYFAKAQLGFRKIDELPWQLVKSWRWNQLHECLSNLDFFDAVWRSNEFDLKTYWTSLERHSSHQATASYFSSELIANASDGHRRILARIGELLYDTGRLESARDGMEALVRRCRVLGDLVCLQESLSVLGTALASLQDDEKAFAVFQEREKICRQLGDPRGVHESLAPQACILQNKGEIEDAKRIYQDWEAFCRKHNDFNGLQACLGDQIGLYSELGQDDKVWALQKEEEQLCRQIRNREGLSRSLMNKSRLLLNAGQLQLAMAAGREAEAIHREIGDRLYLTKDLKNLGDICLQADDPMSAVKYYSEGEQLCRALDFIAAAFAFVADQGRAWAARGSDEQAVAHLRKAADGLATFGTPSERLLALEALASIRRKQQDVRALIELNCELSREYRKTGNQRGLAKNLFSEGALHLTADSYDADAAYRLLREAMDICETHNLLELKTAISPMLEQARRQQQATKTAVASRLGKTDLPGHTVGAYHIESLKGIIQGNAVYNAHDDRERACLLRVGKDNGIWQEGLESLENLANLGEHVELIKETFRSRLTKANSVMQARNSSDLFWFDDTPDILVASWTTVSATDKGKVAMVSMRLHLVNEPRQLCNARWIRDVDALAAKHDIPYSVNSIRAAYAAIFTEFISAVSNGDQSAFCTKETMLLLADKEFMLRISRWIIDMDKRRGEGRNAAALEAVSGGITMLNPSSPLPLGDNILVILQGLQSIGKITPQEMLDTLYSKETFFNLSPLHVAQFEALTVWLRKASVPDSIIRHHEWLCQEAKQLVAREHSSQTQRIEPHQVRLLDSPPCDLATSALCVEYCD